MLRKAAGLMLIGAGFWLALQITSVVYTHIYVEGAKECERFYEDESEWGEIPEEPV
jgi:hypothetical protein